LAPGKLIQLPLDLAEQDKLDLALLVEVEQPHLLQGLG
jgi:hypothetical protein